MSKTFFIIYKTTNIKNNKFYIGMHQTDDLDDGYLGSGTRLSRSIRYHGKENFKKKILHLLESKEEMIQKEIEIVNEELLKDPLCMNLKPGGNGGFSNKNHRYNFLAAGGKKMMHIRRERHLNKMKEDSEYRERFIEACKKGSNQKGSNNGMYNKKHSANSKNKMSISHAGRKNSQFGTCWISNKKENKKILKSDHIPEGWFLGRKMNKK